MYAKSAYKKNERDYNMHILRKFQLNMHRRFWNIVKKLFTRMLHEEKKISSIAALTFFK